MGTGNIANVELEHFYHAKLIDSGQPVADINLAAHSSRITPTEWAKVRALTRIEPFGDERTVFGEPSNALGLFEAGEMGFVLVHAQRINVRDRGVYLPSYHYIILPPSFFVECGGNLMDVVRAGFGSNEQPTFAQRTTIPPIPAVARPAPMQDQLQLVEDLQGITHNTVPMLLQALADSSLLYVANAPTNWIKQFRFVEGLAALMPAGDPLTFVTSYDRLNKPNTKLCFVTTADDADKPLYTWGQPFQYKLIRNGYPAWVFEQIKQPETIVRVESTIGVVTRQIFAKAERRHAYDLSAAFSRVRLATENRQAPNVDDLWFVVETAPLPTQTRQNFFAMLDRVIDKHQPENMIRWYFANNQIDHVGRTIAQAPQVAETVFEKLADQPQAVMEVITGFLGANPPPQVADEVQIKALDTVSAEAQMPLLQMLVGRFAELTLLMQMRTLRGMIDFKRQEAIPRLIGIMRTYRESETVKEIVRVLPISAKFPPDVRDSLMSVWLVKLRGYQADDIFAEIGALRLRPDLAPETKAFETACFLNQWIGSNLADVVTVLGQLSDPGVFLSQAADYLNSLTVKPGLVLIEQFPKATHDWLSHQRVTMAALLIELADLITKDYALDQPLNATTISATPPQIVYWLSNTFEEMMLPQLEVLPVPQTLWADNWLEDVPVVVDILKSIKTSLADLRINKLDTRMTRVELLSRVEDAQPGEQIGLILHYVNRLGETLSAANAHATRKLNEVKQLEQGKLETKFANRAELVDVLRWTAGKLRLSK